MGVLFDGTSVGWAWGIQEGWSRLGEGLWRHFHSGLKESKGTGVEVVLKEVRRQSGTEEP